MNSFGSNTSKKKSNQNQVNPFAQALAETEKRSFRQQTAQTNPELNQVMSQAGANSLEQIVPDLQEDLTSNQAATGASNLTRAQEMAQASPTAQTQAIEEQKAQLKKEQQKQVLREKLHKKVNPVEQTDIFNAKEEENLKKLEQVRKQLKELTVELAKFYKEVDITVTKEVHNPGQTGLYYDNFFEKLRQWIMLLKQKVKSAHTWYKQMQAKKKKKKARKIRGGLDLSANEAKATHDMLHHERSQAYTGA